MAPPVVHVARRLTCKQPPCALTSGTPTSSHLGLDPGLVPSGSRPGSSSDPAPQFGVPLVAADAHVENSLDSQAVTRTPFGQGPSAARRASARNAQLKSSCVGKLVFDVLPQADTVDLLSKHGDCDEEVDHMITNGPRLFPRFPWEVPASGDTYDGDLKIFAHKTKVWKGDRQLGYCLKWFWTRLRWPKNGTIAVDRGITWHELVISFVLAIGFYPTISSWRSSTLNQLTQHFVAWSRKIWAFDPAICPTSTSNTIYTLAALGFLRCSGLMRRPILGNEVPLWRVLLRSVLRADGNFNGWHWTPAWPDAMSPEAPLDLLQPPVSVVLTEADLPKKWAFCPWCKKADWQSHKWQCADMPYDMWLITVQRRAHQAGYKKWIFACPHCDTRYRAVRGLQEHESICRKRRSAVGLACAAFNGQSAIPSNDSLWTSRSAFWASITGRDHRV